MNQFKLLCTYVTLALMLVSSQTGIAQERLVVAPQVSVLDSAIDVVATESEAALATTTEIGFDSNSPIVIQCDEACFEWAENCVKQCNQNAAQCVVVKKSVLGCLEGITVLPQDEVWFVNARECICGETDLSRLRVSKLVCNELVSRKLADLTSAHASGDAFSTVVYVHGNQTSQEFATARGLQVYRNAFAKKAECRVPIRYVIWAWKSEQEKTRLYPDYLVKSKRSLLMGNTLAATLNQFSDRNMVVFGYSLGVQVVLSAFDSPILKPRIGDPTRYKVAFAAPAINSDFVVSELINGVLVAPVARTLVFTNRKDRAIRAAQAIIRRKNPSEDDATTIAELSDAGKLHLGAVTSVDVYNETGRFHSIERYTRSETLQSMMAELVNRVGAKRSANVGATPVDSVLMND